MRSSGRRQKAQAQSKIVRMTSTLRVFDFNSAIVRTPGKSVVNGLRATPGPEPVFETIVAEHQAYIAALQAAGVEVTALDALEQFPDSIFVEDPALVFSEAAILLRPGAPSRMAEAKELASTLAARFPKVLQLREGFADGGDIWSRPDRVLDRSPARTNAPGAADLQRLLESIGKQSKVVEVPRGTPGRSQDGIARWWTRMTDCLRPAGSRAPAC